jgi:uncharacterized protein
MFVLALLCCFAFFAGFIDAMVGGGGLVQLPAMFILYPQLSLVQTLATNKTANFLGTSVAAYQYVRKVHIRWQYLILAIITAFMASFCGALLVSHIHKEQFMPVIIGTLLIVLIYTVWKKNLGLHHAVKPLSDAKGYLYGILIGAVIGFYDGLIGPGTGSFLVFGFIILYGYDFLHASASAKVINWFTNLAALSFFFIQGHIQWHIALPVGVANMVGSYTGSHVAMKKGSAFIRLFFLVVVLALILKLCYDYL